MLCINKRLYWSDRSDGFDRPNWPHRSDGSDRTDRTNGTDRYRRRRWSGRRSGHTAGRFSDNRKSG